MVISDEASARTWLESQPQEVQIAFAARAALRALPRLGSESDGETSRLLLRLVRSSILATVSASGNLDSEVEFVSSAFYLAAADTWSAVADAIFSAHFAVFGKAPADSAASALDSTTRMRAIGYDNDDGLDSQTVEWSGDAWKQANRDAEILENETPEAVFRRPLWSTVSMPAILATQYQLLITYCSQQDGAWDFFLTWYDSMLDGKPLDWELQRRVALIPDEDWEKGAAHIAEKIEEIKAEFLDDSLPEEEEIVFDENIAKFISVPVAINAAELVDTTLKQAEFALNVALTSNCGINSSATAHIYIRHTVENCRDDPNAIEQNQDIAAKDIAEGLASGIYKDDSKLTALRDVLEKGVLDLRANHPKVAEAWEARSKHILRSMEAEQKALIVEKTTEVIAISGGLLQTEMELDAKTIAAKDGGEVQATAMRRFFGRIGRMRLIARSADVIRKIDASSGYKGTRILQTLNNLIDLIVGLF